jgi:mannose/cellobiose epimerase-like protein (N-acyl-D-glucosamine 2-epimerase family)
MIDLRHYGPMTHRGRDDSRAQLAALQAQLTHWLVDAAYPLWARQGVDSFNGGFFEVLGQDGVGLPLARRARVHPRQVYAFAQAGAFGFAGDAAGIVGRGMEYFTAHYRRSDGLFRALAAPDGTILDDRALLYDQAFALLGLAAAAVALDARGEFESRALQLRGLIEHRLGTPDGSLRSDETADAVRESNPHMHLLEACLAWTEIGGDAGWAAWVRRLADLALTRFIRKDSGTIGESYTAAWQPVPGRAGRIVEPGHQFEWAWLLLRCESLHPGPLRESALRLLALGERYGVRHGVAINALFDDFTIADANARFWPQTERLKAALLAATLTGEANYWSMAHAAAASFFPYLKTAVSGLWFDVLQPDGAFVIEPAPASTFYHLVGAIAALNTALRHAGR